MRRLTQPRQARGVIAVAFVLFAGIGQVAAAQQDPSALEQELIYDINRARSNPQAYAAEAGLGNLLDAVAPAPALAVNGRLVASASSHAEEMAANNYFAHQSAVTGTWPNQMAIDQGYVLPSWWPAAANSIESLAAGTNVTTAPVVLRLWIEDLGVNPPGHREHLLATGTNASFYGSHREIGAGFASSANAQYANYWAVHTAVSTLSDLFLTGVVFKDADSDGRYDAGEGLAGVTVTNGSTTVQTNAAGGWSIPVTAGTYTATASGGAYSGTGTATVGVSSANREIDFRSGVAAGEVDFNQQTFNTSPTGGNTGGSSGSSSGGGGGGGGCDAPDGGRGTPAAALAALALAWIMLRSLPWRMNR